ncbi:MAG: hypothetical protein LC798_00260 [Chloroflexi bacterium]|nr:hypothetical protein [Chloroflexota bacterium]
MRDSRRPGGVPDELETEAIAEAVAGRILTLDGEAWTTTTAGGSCGPRTCTLEIAGADPGSQGDDLWVFEVEPATATVEVVSTDLRALPPALVDHLDELTRSIFPGRLQGLNLSNARWLPTPDETQFVMSYRDGDEEGSACGADISVDMIERSVLSEDSLDC